MEIPKSKLCVKKILIGILAIILLAGCVFGGRYIAHTRELRAEEARLAAEEIDKLKDEALAAKDAANEVVAKMAVYLGTQEAEAKKAAYEQAVQLLEEENYEAAIAAFTELADFEAFEALINKADESRIAAEQEAANAEAYETAAKLLEEEKYEEAKAAFEALSDYSDAEEKAAECQKVLDEEQAKIEAAQQETRKEADAKAAWEAEHPEKVVQADGMYHIYEYYPNGLLKSDFLYNVDGSNFNSFEYEYDSAGREIRETKKIGGKFYSSVGTEYDGAGRRAKVTWYNSDGTVDFYTTNEYNSVGQHVKTTFYDANGVITRYHVEEYDSTGQHIKMTYYNADGTVDSYMVYEYDSTGQHMAATHYHADGTVWFTSTY